MQYRIGERVKRDKRSIKKYIVGAVASVLMVGGAAVPALAAYGTQPGFTTSTSNTDCAGHGSFGAFGQKGDYGHDFRGGASGDNTAYNNSGLCGNPSDNSAAATLGDTPN